MNLYTKMTYYEYSINHYLIYADGYFLWLKCCFYLFNNISSSSIVVIIFIILFCCLQALNISIDQHWIVTGVIKHQHWGGAKTAAALT